MDRRKGDILKMSDQTGAWLQQVTKLGQKKDSDWRSVGRQDGEKEKRMAGQLVGRG